MVIQIITDVKCPVCDQSDKGCSLHKLPELPHLQLLSCTYCWEAWREFSWTWEDTETHLKLTKNRSLELRSSAEAS